MNDEYVDYVEVYRDQSGGYRWSARSNNGQILADSGESYKTYSYALLTATRAFPKAIIKDREAE